MRISVSVHDTGGPADLRRLDLRPTLASVARQWSTEIRQRTLSGRDVDGGRLRPKRDGSASNLKDTGAMLGSLAADVDADGFTLSPAGARNRQIAFIQQNTGRRFMGASPDQISDARQTVADAIKRDRR